MSSVAVNLVALVQALPRTAAQHQAKTARMGWGGSVKCPGKDVICKTSLYRNQTWRSWQLEPPLTAGSLIFLEGLSGQLGSVCPSASQGTVWHWAANGYHLWLPFCCSEPGSLTGSRRKLSLRFRKFHIEIQGDCPVQCLWTVYTCLIHV